MSNPLRTPHRFSLDEEEQPFTPCTRLSNMTIESQANGNSRFRKTALHGSPINLLSKFTEVATGNTTSPHPNLDMCLGSDRISIFDKTKDGMFSEDEDSDDGDFFSSNLGLMSSPDRPFTRHTLLDDETMHSPPDMPMMGKRSIFTEDDDEEEEEDYLDSGNTWLSQLFCDNQTTIEVNELNEPEEDMAEQQENRPPRLWKKQTYYQKSTENQSRLPLREIHCDEEDGHTKKKSVSAHGKPQKMRYMRTLSPTRLTPRKESTL